MPFNSQPWPGKKPENLPLLNFWSMGWRWSSRIFSDRILIDNTGKLTSQEYCLPLLSMIFGIQQTGKSLASIVRRHQ